ncbi:hypothetical protein AB1L30_10485 [Bremerella sp. JC817]|uniref:hypothetical protein n=1 Tax=Bremerella sp. JC817 TaxID=3231756 RepID=UPI00345A8299
MVLLAAPLFAQNTKTEPQPEAPTAKVDPEAIRKEIDGLQRKLSEARKADIERQLAERREQEKRQEQRSSENQDKIKTMKKERVEMLQKLYEQTKTKFDAAEVGLDLLLKYEDRLADAEYDYHSWHGYRYRMKRLKGIEAFLEEKRQNTDSFEIDLIQVKERYLKTSIDQLDAIEQFNHGGYQGRK